jgi:hypothetical protein
MKKRNYPAIEPVDILRYYVNYIDFEKPLLDILETQDIDRDETLKRFRKFKNTYMSVGRNFKSETDAQVLEILNSNISVGNYDVLKLSDEYLDKELLNPKIKKAYSACSKFIWLFNKETIIVDSLNRAALGIYDDDYQLYCDKWKEVFSQKRNEIMEVIYSHNLTEKFPVMQQEWYIRRVFDQYLMGI